MSKPRLLCVGEVLVEMVAEDLGQSARSAGRWIGPYPSGAPAILADQAALCGADVTLVGSVGADAFGECCLDRLREDGVRIDNVAIHADKPTGVAFVRYFADGSRSFIFHVAQTAAARFRPDDLGTQLAGADCVHLMGSSAFSEAAVQTLGEVAAAAVAGGIAVSFDPNVRAEMLTDPSFTATLERILQQSTYVLASEGELPLLMGIEDDLEAARALLADTAEIVVLKRGDRGAVLMLPGAEPQIFPAHQVDEVDATGAGDCFGGTFLALLLQGRDPAEATRYASVAGALAVTQRGPMSGNRGLSVLAERLRTR
ncbi:MAG: sugar kinase [Propioniciclava sp.]